MSGLHHPRRHQQLAQVAGSVLCRVAQQATNRGWNLGPAHAARLGQSGFGSGAKLLQGTVDPRAELL